MLCLLRLLGLLLRGRSGKVIAAVLAALVSLPAMALCDEWMPESYQHLGWFGTPEKACAAIVSYTSSTAPAGSPPLVFTGLDGDVCLMYRGSSDNKYRMGLYKRSNESCNKCTLAAGQMTTLNYTRGWARSPLPNKADQLGSTAAIPGSICHDGCKYGVLGNEEAYRSQTPSAQGLYRLSSDVTAIQTDQTCTADESTAATSPQTPDKPCPGQLGELNGKPFCAVSTSDTGVQPNGPPGKEADDKGNPTAGPKPVAGEGSGTGGVGRTPTEGNGGNMGGPAGAAAGGSGNKPGDKPNGTVNKPGDGKEQAACGAPGQPKCAIDETGTPKVSPNEYDKAVDQYKVDADALRARVSAADDKSYFSGWKSMWFAPAVVACQPFQLPSFLGVSMGAVIDPCAVVEGVRYFMAYLWALGGLYLCMRMVTQTVRGGS